MRHYLQLSMCALFIASFTGCGPKHYRATATIQIEHETIPPGTLVCYVGNRTDIDVKILESARLLQEVAAQLIEDTHTTAFLSPYSETENSLESIIHVLAMHRTVEAIPEEWIIHITYAHPDPMMAATVANTFAEAYIHYDKQLRIDQAMKQIEDLRIRAQEQIKRVESIELKLAQANEAKQTNTEAYQALQKDFEVQQSFMEALLERMVQEKTCSGTLVKPTRIIKRATVAH